MADTKFTDQLVRLKCDECDRENYHVRKNSKQVKRKLEFKKFCKWCRKHTMHVESK